MFAIKNKSVKPIHIDGSTLLPGEKMMVKEDFEEYVELYKKLGYIQTERVAEAADVAGNTAHGYMDKAQLKAMSAADVKNLAAEMGLLIEGKTKAVLVDEIASVQCEVPLAAMNSENRALPAEVYG